MKYYSCFFSQLQNFRISMIFGIEQKVNNNSQRSLVSFITRKFSWILYNNPILKFKRGAYGFESAISSICDLNIRSIAVSLLLRMWKEKKKRKCLSFTSISSCVTPMSAARKDILSESGCLQDLKASSSAVDFSLSSSIFLRISAIVCYFALVAKSVENLHAWILLVFSGFCGQLGLSDIALELIKSNRPCANFS